VKRHLNAQKVQRRIAVSKKIVTNEDSGGGRHCRVGSRSNGTTHLNSNQLGGVGKCLVELVTPGPKTRSVPHKWGGGPSIHQGVAGRRQNKKKEKKRLARHTEVSGQAEQKKKKKKLRLKGNHRRSSRSTQSFPWPRTCVCKKKGKRCQQTANPGKESATSNERSPLSAHSL